MRLRSVTLGVCPVYTVGDRIRINGARILLNKTDAICVHALPILHAEGGTAFLRSQNDREGFQVLVQRREGGKK